MQVLTLRVLSAAHAVGMQCTSCTVVKMRSMSATVSCGYKLRVQPDICSIFMFKCIVQQTVSYVIRAGIRHSNIPADSRTLGGMDDEDDEDEEDELLPLVRIDI